MNITCKQIFCMFNKHEYCFNIKPELELKKKKYKCHSLKTIVEESEAFKENQNKKGL